MRGVPSRSRRLLMDLTSADASASQSRHSCHKLLVSLETGLCAHAVRVFLPFQLSHTGGRLVDTWVACRRARRPERRGRLLGLGTRGPRLRRLSNLRALLSGRELACLSLRARVGRDVDQQRCAVERAVSVSVSVNEVRGEGCECERECE